MERILTASQDLIQHEHGPKPAILALNQAIEERRLEVALIRVTLAEALHGLKECLEKYGCDAPASVTGGLTSIVELQEKYRL